MRTCISLAVPLGFLSAAAGELVRHRDSFSRRTRSSPFHRLMLALICISALGTSLYILVLTVAFIEAVRVFRIARALAISIFSADFVEIARLRGESIGWIMRHEILLNTLGPLATDFGLRFTYCILLVSSLSFLGLGVGQKRRSRYDGARESRGVGVWSARGAFSVCGGARHNSVSELPRRLVLVPITEGYFKRDDPMSTLLRIDNLRIEGQDELSRTHRSVLKGVHAS